MKIIIQSFLLLFAVKGLAAENVAQFSDSIGEVDINTNTPTTYLFNKTDLSSPNVQLNGSKIEVSKSGIYQVNYSLSWRAMDNQRRLIKTVLVKNGTEEVAQGYGYTRRENQGDNAANTATFYLELLQGDYIELQHEKYSEISGSALTNANESWIGIQYIEPINSTTLATSCNDILQQNPNSLDGTYTISPNGDITDTLDVYCDMTTDNGGWTLVMRGTDGDYAGWTTSERLNLTTSPSPYSNYSFKLSDNDINTIKTTAYRVTNLGPENITRYFRAACEYNHVSNTYMIDHCTRSFSDLNWNGLVQGNDPLHGGLSDYNTDANQLYIITSGLWVNADRKWFVGDNTNGYATTNGAVYNGNYSGNVTFNVWVK